MTATPRRLPIDLVVRRSFLFAWESRSVLMTPLIIYAVVTMLADIAVSGVLGTADQFVKGLLVVTEQLFAMGFAVGIHRFVLGGEARPGFGFFHWDRYFLRYLLLSLALLLLVAVAVVMVLGAVGFDPGTQAVAGSGGAAALLGSVALFVVSLIITRMSLMLPAAAMGEDVPARTIWQATEGNAFRLLATALITLMPFLELEMLLLSSSGGGQPPLIVTVLLSLVTSAQLVVLTIMLALSYDLLVRGGGPPAP